jgi:general secretion pathway protein I
MQSQTLSMTTANRFYTIAPMLAQGKMAQLETASDDIIAEDSGDFGEKFPGYSWSVATAEVSSEALGEVGKDLKQIEVTVALNENEYVYSIRTYRLMRN